MRNHSPIVEQRLAGYGIVATLVDDFPLDTIDRAASLRLQNRGGVELDQQHVLQMWVALDDPDHVLPPIVVGKYRGRTICTDGNHRVAAYDEAERTRAWAYVLPDDVPDETVELLALEANADNSKSLTYDERITLALTYAESANDVPLAARRFGFRPADLQQKRRVRAGQEKARRAVGIQARLTDVKAEALNRLAEEQIKGLGRAVIEGSEGRALKEAVANIVAVPPSESALQVAREAGRLAEAIKAKKTPVGRARAKAPGPTLKQAVGQLRKIAAALRANPSWRADADIVAAVDALILATTTTSEAGQHGHADDAAA